MVTLTNCRDLQLLSWLHYFHTYHQINPYSPSPPYRNDRKDRPYLYVFDSQREISTFTIGLMTADGARQRSEFTTAGKSEPIRSTSSSCRAGYSSSCYCPTFKSNTLLPPAGMAKERLISLLSKLIRENKKSGLSFMYTFDQ